MKQTYKQRALSSRGRAAEPQIKLPTEAASDTTDAADLINEINELLGEEA